MAPGTYRLTVTWREGNRPVGNHFKDSLKQRDRRREVEACIFQGFVLGTPRYRGEERDSNIHVKDVAEAQALELNTWAHTPAPPLAINSCVVSGKFCNL